MNEIVDCENRLKSMIIKDKGESPERICKVLKSELLHVLKNYFELCSEDLTLNIGVTDMGKFQINLYAESRCVKVAHVF